MRAIFTSCFALATALAAGCSTNASEDVASSEHAQVSDVVSMSPRSDGRFDVVCRGANGEGNYNEIATELDVRSNAVCSRRSPPPTTGLLVRGGNRQIALGNGGTDREVEQWGRDLWEGFASFDVVLSGSEAGGVDKARLVDASGARYELSKTRTRFDRLPVPIRLLASTDGSDESFAELSSVTFEVTRTNPIATLSGKYDGTNPAIVRMIGTDLEGATMNVSAQARFYDNFTNGNACSRVTFKDGLGQTVTLQPSSTSGQLTLTAPVEVRVQPICVSSRLATQENGDADFELAISTIRLSDADPAHAAPSVIIYGTSDSCADSSAVATVKPLTDCASLSDSDSSWSVKVDGRCIDISDTSIRKACVEHHP